MAVPDFQTLMLPLLELAGDGNEHAMSEAVEYIAKRFTLSDKERNELLPSGQQRRLDNRVGWTRTHLTKAGLLETTKTSHFRITATGQRVLTQKPQKIDMLFLDQFPGHLEFRKGNSKGKATISPIVSDLSQQPPKEIIESAYQRLQEELAQQLLDVIKKQSPIFFERLVIDLLLAMGYGGSREDAGQRIGGSGDGGVDGIIREDRLGLETIYVQAKRWDDGTVGSPEVQKFVGALTKRNAKKGVFITTSTFTADARNFVENLQYNVALIDGRELAQLLIEHNVGVTGDVKYEVKKINSDYFTDG
jgi:restriction system protein